MRLIRTCYAISYALAMQFGMHARGGCPSDACIPISTALTFVSFREQAKAFEHARGQHLRPKAPAPIAGRLSWLVHPSLVAQAQDILQRGHGVIGHGCPS